jgi:hypothetical protein
MYPTEPLSQFQQRLTRICLTLNTTVLAILLGIFWQFSPMLYSGIAQLMPMAHLPLAVSIGLGLLYVLCYLGTIPTGFFLIMAISNYARMMSVFLPESAPVDIPEGKYQRDLAILMAVGEPIESLSFFECDRYYLGGAYRLLVIVYKHAEDNIYWSTIRLIGRTTITVLGASFDGNLTLETSGVRAAGKSPMRLGAYLQVTPMVSPQVLLTIHQDAIALFAEAGYRCQPTEDIRARQLLNLQRYSSHLRTFAYWPVRMTLWAFFQSNFQYRKTLREQVAAGKTTIPPR